MRPRRRKIYLEMDGTANKVRVSFYRRDLQQITQLGYRSFCNDINSLNKGFYVDRPTTERAWVNLCQKKARIWEGSKLAPPEDQTDLIAAVEQVWYSLCLIHLHAESSVCLIHVSNNFDS